MKNKTIITATALFLAGCAASVHLMTPTQSDVDRIKVKYPEYTLAQLNQGKTLYENNCSSCHGLKKPASESEQEWNKIVPEMTRKANRKGANIDAQQQELILKYLITMGSAGK